MNREYSRAELTAAQRQLDDAISRLTGLRGGVVGARRAIRPSRYEELCRAVVPGRGSDAHQRTIVRAPGRVASIDLRHTIDRTVATWIPGTTGTTPHRLETLLGKHWTPHDINTLTAFAHTLNTWSQQIDDHIDPPLNVAVAAPCPACDQRHVYRYADDGERRRTAALTVTTTGCTCQACGHHWPPEHFELLAATLECTQGEDPPTGSHGPPRA